MAKGRKDFGKESLNHRFQKGNTENKKRKKIHNGFKYREMLSYISCQPVNLKFNSDGGLDMAALDRSLLKLMYDGKGETHVARIVAVRALERVIKKMEPELLKQLIENTEGKLPETVIMDAENAAPTTFASDEEAAAAYQKYMKRKK